MWTDAQMRAMDKMLNPRSIAVVGAMPKGGELAPDHRWVVGL
jgi:acyl-CoA synthetase (NDP forming)